MREALKEAGIAVGKIVEQLREDVRERRVKTLDLPSVSMAIMNLELTRVYLREAYRDLDGYSTKPAKVAGNQRVNKEQIGD